MLTNTTVVLYVQMVMLTYEGIIRDSPIKGRDVSSTASLVNKLFAHKSGLVTVLKNSSIDFF